MDWIKDLKAGDWVLRVSDYCDSKAIQVKEIYPNRHLLIDDKIFNTQGREKGDASRRSFRIIPFDKDILYSEYCQRLPKHVDVNLRKLTDKDKALAILGILDDCKYSLKYDEEKHDYVLVKEQS